NASGSPAASTASPATATSVRYTRAASTSPTVTFVRAARTSCSSVTGVSVTPAASSAVRPAAPHGTCSAHSATLRSGSARSARPAIPCGLPAATAMTSSLLAKTAGWPAAAPATSVMVSGLAEANTSAGAPWSICWASVELPAKLKVTLTPGWASSKSRPIRVNASVSEAAANTTSSPVTSPDPGSPAGRSESPEVQAAVELASASTASRPAARRVRVMCGSSSARRGPPPRRRSGTPSRGGPYTPMCPCASGSIHARRARLAAVRLAPATHRPPPRVPGPSGHQLGGGVAQAAPGGLDVRRSGVRGADRQPQHEPPVDPGVGEEQLAAGVDPPQQLLVHLVRRVQAEAHQRERVRRHDLEPPVGADQVGEPGRQPHPGPDVGPQPLGAVPAQHEPQLQGTEPAAQRHLPVPVVDDRAGGGRGVAQVLRQHRQRVDE